MVSGMYTSVQNTSSSLHVQYTGSGQTDPMELHPGDRPVGAVLSAHASATSSES